MKKIFKPALAPVFALAAGAVGFALRLWLFRTGVDEKGLLVTNHPAGTACWILTALAILAIFLCVRPLEPVGKYSLLFPARPLAGIGCILAAAGIVYVNIRDLLQRQDAITVVTLILGVVAAIALVFLGSCRWRSKRPSFWVQAAVTLYFMLHLVSQYRLWSAEPQLAVYFFPLLASVLLMLTAYHGTVLDVNKNGSRRWYVFSSQAALFFCLLSLQESTWPFYLTMAFWVATGLCSLTTAPLESEET